MFLMFLNHFNMKNKFFKKIINIYFNIKNYLKNNYNYIIKQV